MGSTDAPVEASLLVVALMLSVEASLLEIALIPSMEVSLLVMALISLCGSTLASNGTDAHIRASLP